MNELHAYSREEKTFRPSPRNPSMPSHEDWYHRLSAWFAAMRALEDSHGRLLRKLSLTPQQCAALATIACHAEPPGPTVGTLASLLRVRHNTVVYALNRLVALGMVERVQSQEDRRCVYLRVTARGQEVMQRYVREDLKALGAMRQALVTVLDEPAETEA